MSFQGVPIDMTDEHSHRRRMAVAINSILQGKINAVTAITLNKSATTTTVNDPRIDVNSAFALTPLTADAATAYIAGIYFNNQVNGQVTLNHASSSHTDQNFNLTIIG